MTRATTMYRRLHWQVALVVATGLVTSTPVLAQRAEAQEASVRPSPPGLLDVSAAGRPPAPSANVGLQATARSLSLREAIERALEFNLSVVARAQTVGQAQGQRRIALSALLPNVVGTVTEAAQRVNLGALGVRLDTPIPGVEFPDAVGPFNVIDVRARLSQVVLDRSALHNYRASTETLRANQYSVEDARTVIILAVGTAYLQAVATRARVESVRAQVATTTTLFQRASLQRTAGLATPLDLDRAQVQMLTLQQRLVAQQAVFAKQKIDLARLAGLPPNDQYELNDDVAFSAASVPSLEQALQEAAGQRSDLKAADAQVRAAERSLAAAQARRLPTVTIDADFGANRANPTPTQSTFTVAGTLRVPIWEGRRADGEIEQARATLAQRRAERDDLSAQVEAEVRKAYLDLEAAAGQVRTAEASMKVSRESLVLTRQRFDAGVSDNVELVRAQESVALGEFDYTDSVFSHNLAKLGLARAIGRTSENLDAILRSK